MITPSQLLLPPPTRGRYSLLEWLAARKQLLAGNAVLAHHHRAVSHHGAHFSDDADCMDEENG